MTALGRRHTLVRMYHSPARFDDGLLSFSYPLYQATDEELDYFLGGIVKSVSRAASGVAKAAGGVVRTAGKGLSAVEKVVPVSVLTSTLSHTPIGMAVRAGMGAVKAAAEGRNVFQGAVRSLASDPVMRFYVDTGFGVASGKNIAEAAKRAAQAGIADTRESLRFAAMVAPFVPGIGTGVGAALAAANALAAGQPITAAIIAAARNAIPGGAVAQMGFDAAVSVARGGRLTDALLSAARSRLPGGPAAQAAFDAGLALAKGQSIQQAAFSAAGRVLPPSPYAADALAFVRQVANGGNIQRAALSRVGNIVMNRIERQTGPIASRIPHVPGVQREFPDVSVGQRRAASGRWVRQNGKLIVLGAAPI